MPKPRFTDKNRFPRGPYTPANQTNVAETFARVREELAKNAAEAKVKVQPMKRRA